MLTMRTVAVRRLLCVGLFVVIAGWVCSAQDPTAPASPSKKIGMEKEIWIAVRTDGQPGTGLASDPFDGSTEEKFDGLLIGLNRAGVTNITIHLGPGTFQTLGATEWRNPADWRDGCTGWCLSEGWKLLGAGMGNTTIKLASLARIRDYRWGETAGVSVRDGVWEFPAPKGSGWIESPDMWQAVRLSGGTQLKGLELGKVYYIAQVLDATHFKVSTTLGGPPLAEASIGSDGKFFRITKIPSSPWPEIVARQGPQIGIGDIEIRDLAVDCNWPAMGGVLTEDFTMPAELKTVIVTVDTAAWARPMVNMWVNVLTPLKTHKVIGHFEVVRVVDDHRIELRNMRGFKLLSGAPFGDEGTKNVDAGTVVVKGTRIGPEMNAAGVLVYGDRVRVERVRVTNHAATWYEGGCGIALGHWQGPPCHEMVVRDCVVDTMWGKFTMAMPFLSRKISDPCPPADEEVVGAQGIVEGNTIYSNGGYLSGMGCGGGLNTTFRNNKVFNAGCGLYSEGPVRNIIIKDNLFFECGSAITMGGGNRPPWARDAAYKAKGEVFWKDAEYRAKVDNVGQEPPNEQYWQPLHPWIGTITIEGNLMELCDRSAGIQFLGMVDGLYIRNNLIRYARGNNQGALGVTVSDKTNRRMVITGNVIDSRLMNSAGKGLMLGRDNVDEQGRIRKELETGEHAAAIGRDILPNLEPLVPATDARPADKPVEPLVANLGPKGEIQDWLVLCPFPHPPMNTADGSKLGMGYGFDFLSNLGGEAKIRPKSGESMAVKFPSGADAKAFWKDEYLKPRRIAWQRAHAASFPGQSTAETRREWVDFQPLVGLSSDADNTCAYAFCILRAEKACQVSLSLGTDDGYVLFVNGQREGELRNDRRTYLPDSNVHKATLRAGDNTVLIKVCNAIGGFGFGIRAISAETADLAIPGGKPAAGVKVVLP
jgi:hypothetical protein